MTDLAARARTHEPRPALAVSIGVGVLAGVAPALRAARLDPVEALRAE